MAKNRLFALYGTWEGLVWCKILPRGVGAICPYFGDFLFVDKIEKCKLSFFLGRTLHEIILDKIGFYRIIYMTIYYDIS